MVFFADEVSAVTVACTGATPDKYKQAYIKDANSSNTTLCIYVPILTEPSTITLTPTVSMSIDDGTNVSKQVTAEYNKSNYSAHTVNVTASNVSAYTLTLSDVKISGPTTLTGASSIKGSVLANNSWGYGWDVTSISNDDITYSSAASRNLADVSVSNNALNLSKKLVFATKFGESASAGGYKVTATLSLTATPATVTESYVHWDNLVYMQDMTTEACAEATINTPEKTLIDIRNDSTYTVKKLSDGKCWMTQNLRITGDSAKLSLSEYDSNLATNTTTFTLPSSALWSDTSAATNKAYYNNDTAYGAYYTYYTATAGTNPSSGEATSSICPKGWRLPTNAEYQTLYGKGKSSWTTHNSKNGYWLGATTANATGAAFFPAAGFVYTNSGSLRNAGSSGYYWSSAVFSSSSTYYLTFDGNNGLNTYTNNKYFGYSVRCVAK